MTSAEKIKELIDSESRYKKLAEYSEGLVEQFSKNTKQEIESELDEINKAKNLAVYSQQYEYAAALRTYEKQLIKLINQL